MYNNVKIVKMKNQSIKNRIKQVINANPNMDMSLSVGLVGTVLNYTSKKEFRERVSYTLENDKVKDIAFKGIENNTLVFQTQYKPSKDTFINRGYGQGRYMGD